MLGRYLHRVSIASRLALVGAAAVAAAVTISIFVSLNSIDAAMRARAQAALDTNIAIAHELLNAKAAVARVEGGQLKFGQYTVNGNYEVVDKVKTIAGGVATMFMGDTRVATNVTKDDGSRAVGTKLAPGPAYDAIFRDHRAYRGEADILGKPYFTVYDPIIGQDGSTLGIVFVGVQKSDFLMVLDAIIRDSGIAGLVASLIAAASLLLMVRRTLRPLDALRSTMVDLADEKFHGDIPGQSRQDEVGHMAAAVAVFKTRMIEGKRLRAEQDELTRRAAQDRQALLHKLADEFDHSIRASLETLETAANELRTTSDGMSATAEETSRQATAVAAAAEEASANVQTVASAAEELTSSVGEIGRQVGESTKIASQAVGQAEHTNASVQGLSAAAQKIGDVVKLISDIASQTNLLALNATIEAARAGEAGKGFAVVASEVKSLANQTAKATEDITSHVAEMRGATGEAVHAIEGIGATIGTMNQIATTIAAAVEEQGAATQEIARNVQEASKGTGQVSSNIAGVNEAAGETGSAASRVLSASEALGGQAKMLRAEVDKFLGHLRAA